MASDVARKFLLEPNPAVWDSDFAEMKRNGINMVRTGLWTAWKNLMLDVGSFNEAALRSLDAFILTAHKYDIPVIFSFFAFIPETWGGENAYLDPRSVNAQHAFLAAIAQRYSSVDDIIWDLINEPSFCNPKALWSCRPNYDRFEVAAWNEWLLARAPLSSYQQKWRMTTQETPSLPRFDEFSDLNIFDDRRPLKVVEYRLFAQEMFQRWIGQTRRQRMPFQMVDRHQRLVCRHGQRLGTDKPHHHAADQAWPSGGGNGIALIQCNVCILQHGSDHGGQPVSMGTRGDFGHYSAIGGMFCLLRCDMLRQYGTVSADQRHGGFIAR